MNDAASDRFGPQLLRGVDGAAFAVALALKLRRAGVTVGFPDIQAFARALTASPAGERSQLYWVARVCLVRRQPDIAVFDAVFDAVFGESVLALDPHARRQSTPVSDDEDDAFARLPAAAATEAEGGGLPWLTLPAITADTHDSDTSLSIPERLPSSRQAMADTPFDELDDAELDRLAGWLDEALRDWPLRRSRRLAAHAHGHQIALRPTLIRARRTGFEPIHLVRTRPQSKPRRIVMLCDVSQSMQPYARAYLHLMRALTVTTEAEAFAFATSLTRLTRVLRHRSPQVAIGLATAGVGDRYGGTRIAFNLRALLSSHHAGSTRGAVVLIASDGWDSDPPAELASVMARLRRRAYKVIWMNPRVASPGYEPRVGAMAAALPYCDELLPANTLRSLEQVVSAITTGTSSTASRGPKGESARSRPRHP